MPVPSTDWAYFFDIDGTLADIAPSPTSVRIGRRFRATIERLHRSTGGAVALISGRSISDVDRLFPGTRLPVAGQHGVERRNASGVVSRHEFPSDQLELVHDRLAEVVTRHPGLLLEHKGLSLALHYRRVPRLAGFAHRLLRSEEGRIGSEYSIQTGKRVVEIKPAGKDKGVAVLEFMAEKPFRGRTPVFVGDDRTDEFGFVVVNRLGGHSVKVGVGRTAARWRLPDVNAVRSWLELAMAAPKRATGSARRGRS